MNRSGLTKIGGLLVLLGIVLALSPTIGVIVSTYEYVMYVFYILIGCGVGILASTQILEKEVYLGEKHPSPTTTTSTTPVSATPTTTEETEEEESREEKS